MIASSAYLEVLLVSALLAAAASACRIKTSGICGLFDSAGLEGIMVLKRNLASTLSAEIESA